MMKASYYTVRVLPGLSPWAHPTEILTRGVFDTPEQASTWARETLGDNPWDLAFVDDERGEVWHRVVRADADTCAICGQPSEAWATFDDDGAGLCRGCDAAQQRAV
jgi:hypothetical protein